jgi:radical SAM superfamily enzyme YgiQ (UPF0313 family)
MAWKRPDNYDGVPENIEDYAPGRAAGRCFMGWSHEEDPVLESLGKKDTLAMNREAVKWAREAGLRIRADYIVGTPAGNPRNH